MYAYDKSVENLKIVISSNRFHMSHIFGIELAALYDLEVWKVH